MKFKGTVRKEDLGPGVFVLETREETYTLDTSDKALRKDGLQVEIEGDVDADAASIAMSGPVLKVRSWKAAP